MSFNIAAEQAVLGGLMLDNSVWETIADCITAEDFHRHDHKLIFKAISALAGRGEPFDAVTLAEELDRDSNLEDAGGLGYLKTLIDQTPTACNIRSYADIVRDKAMERQQNKLAQQLLQSDNQHDREHIIEQLTLVKTRDVAGAVDTNNIVSLKDAEPSLSSTYLVKGVIGQQGIVGLIGESNSGKTYVAIDIGCTAALGKNWCGHRTSPGLWIHVCLEGFAAANNRLAALKIEKPHLANAPFELLKFNLNLMSKTSCKQLVKLILERVKELGIKIAAIVIDTFNAATPGCPENDAGPMSEALGSVRYLRDELGATIILIHHLGKDLTRGARGHSSFKAALDSELTIEQNAKTRVLRSTKQRDFETDHEVMAFTLKAIVLGHDVDGDEVKSCVVVPTEFIPTNDRPTGKCQRQLLAELERRCTGGDLGIWPEGELREIARELGMHKSSARDAVHGLRQLGYFVPTIGGDRLQFVPAQGTKERNRDESSISTRSVRDEKDEGSIEPVLSSRTSSLGATK